jgi:ABC-type transport system involved in Fe-S cluster assembly fused permease/ATPase subunit
MRFHMNRRTGAVTKVIERGTKSIDVMLYFMLFNIAPTADRADVAVLAIFADSTSAGGWSAATVIMVVAYIVFTRRSSPTGATSCARR